MEVTEGKVSRDEGKKKVPGFGCQVSGIVDEG
jgi:hypothetical protein